MLVSFNPSISTNQNKKQNPTFECLVNKITVPKDIGDTDDIFYSFCAKKLTPDEKTLKDLDNAYLNCKAFLREAMIDIYEKLNRTPPQV